ncbi:hypothetical protein [Vibrio sp. 818]|uniref:hypothetical protein n=1 Tax=Vibrio sp. 818 TaxID=3074617 RepID=UPI0029654328|nr:hypothetical protein [Vibrio sp. 818]
MLPWIFKKALECDAKFNDAGRDEDFAPVFNVGVLVHGKIPLVGYIPCLLAAAVVVTCIRSPQSHRRSMLMGTRSLAA